MTSIIIDLLREEIGLMNKHIDALLAERHDLLSVVLAAEEFLDGRITKEQFEKTVRSVTEKFQ